MGALGAPCGTCGAPIWDPVKSVEAGAIPDVPGLRGLRGAATTSIDQHDPYLMPDLFSAASSAIMRLSQCNQCRMLP